MRTAVPIAGDRPVAVPPDLPVGVDPSQLPGTEVVDALVLLHVDRVIREDEVGVHAGWTRGGLQPSQKSGPQSTRHVVDGPAGVHEVERPLGQESRRVAVYPPHLDAGHPREALGLAEAGSRNIHGSHIASAAGEEDAVASFPAAELEHPGAGREQRAQPPCERGGSRTQDVFVRPPSVFERPRAPRRHVNRQRAPATTRPCRSTASSASFAGSTAVRLRISFTAAFSSPSTLGSSGSPPRLRPTAARTIPPAR